MVHPAEWVAGHVKVMGLNAATRFLEKLILVLSVLTDVRYGVRFDAYGDRTHRMRSAFQE